MSSEPSRTPTPSRLALFLLLSAAISSPVIAQESVELEVFSLVDGALETATHTFEVDSLTLSVPENRSDSASRVIDIPVIRVRALSERSETPVFWLGGGPGQTNLRTFDYDYFIDRHDHVMVGYRGVDGSTSLDCAEVSTVLREVDDILEETALDSVGEAFERCWDRLTEEGVDIDGYTLIEVVRDIDAARRELGYDRIDIVAESFGTRLGYLYTLVFPEFVHRMILIGAQPPGGMVWDPYQADDLIRVYGRLWSQDPEASARHPDLVEAVRSVNRNMARRWLFMPIYPGNVKASAHAMMFHRETAAKVFDTYVAAANGDASGLWMISVVAPFIFPEVVNWGENASKAVSADHEPGRDYFRELLPREAVFGAPLGSFLWAPASRWPIQPMPKEYRTPDTSFVPTLIISGNLDLSTPAENARSGLLPYLPNATHVVLSEMGHIMDLWRVNPEATYELVTSFIEEGAVDASAVKRVPMDFDVSWGFPVLAKLLATVAVVTAALLTFLVWLLVRTIRRRRERML